ncbi:Conserved_hypothetical protein [Hexamita inflata]|uniref:Uncharacterized protein n=1 Tax=Hexamita inflata TaxID=28002 RepID=A0AA86QZP1_9EUKA|nr:Conserved hypothetical protein [Hexamita inflata]CAI9963602.1 Conserved hypothetical protein [Hexamita inflata]
MSSIPSSYSDCYSAKSFLNINSLTNQLELHLIPFERLERIQNENLCKMYFPGKLVIVQIHFDDISFPKAGTEVNFIYQFNQGIVITFQLTQMDYLHIADKQNAMYELWYDVNLVKVNNSINSIHLIKFDGNECFTYIDMVYTIYENITINVIPNMCQVKYDNTLEVYLEFQDNNINNQIRIYPCQSNCDPNEFKISSTNFQEITIYKIHKSDLIATQLSSFYKNFIHNRLIPISFNIKYKVNGSYTIISKSFDNKTARDTWGCTSDPHLILASTLNPNNLFIQFRDSLENKMTCDTKQATTVVIDDYIWDDEISYRVQRSLPISEFNQQVGVTFDTSEALKRLRSRYSSKTMSLTVISFIFDSTILWEISCFDIAYLGCISKATLHLYSSNMCISYQFDNSPLCVNQFLSSSSKNTFGLFYAQNGINQLWFFRFNYEINYSVTTQNFFFNCSMYLYEEEKNCKIGMETAKNKLKEGPIGFGIISKFESIVFWTTVSEYRGIYIPVICAVGVMITVGAMFGIWAKISVTKGDL